MNRIGRYEIQGQIGRGGMGVVHRAHDPHFDRAVAIKMLPANLTSDEITRTRFEREAKTIASLGHSCIVPVFDFGEHQGQPYLVMSYMQGGSLAEKLKREGPLDIQDISQILGRVTAALDAAHEKSFVHRDVKPANILFDKYDYAFLSDFGIVKLSEATIQLTGSSVVGTPHYMAPEMLDLGTLTSSIDIYALTVTLYQMLTGEMPYDGDSAMRILLRHATQPVPDIRVLRPDLPASVTAIIQRGMAKKPEDRYTHAGDIAHALEQALNAQSAEIQSSEALVATDSIQIELPRDIPATEALRDAEESATSSEIPKPQQQAKRKTGLSKLSTVGCVALIGIIGVIVTGIIIAVGVFSGNSANVGTLSNAPTSTSLPEGIEQATSENGTSTPSPTPEAAEQTRQAEEVQQALSGVNTNDEWTPFIQELTQSQMALVPAGCFLMGTDTERADQRPAHEVCFEQPFWIDAYEVTNGQFNSLNGQAANESSTTSANNPRDNISWFEADAFCQLRNARLPTEAEWEYAARGPDGLIYPWGNEFVANNTVYRDNAGGQTAPVGSRAEGVSWVGAYDMSGNVWEWVADWYDSNYYAVSPSVNPQGPSESIQGARVMRGGAWHNLPQEFGTPYLYATDRFGVGPSVIDFGGFRCANSY